MELHAINQSPTYDYLYIYKYAGINHIIFVIFFSSIVICNLIFIMCIVLENTGLYGCADIDFFFTLNVVNRP